MEITKSLVKHYPVTHILYDFNPKFTPYSKQTANDSAK